MPPCAEDDKHVVRRRHENRPLITLTQLHEHHKPDDMWIGACSDPLRAPLSNDGISSQPTHTVVLAVRTMLLCSLFVHEDTPHRAVRARTPLLYGVQFPQHREVMDILCSVW